MRETTEPETHTQTQVEIISTQTRLSVSQFPLHKYNIFHLANHFSIFPIILVQISLDLNLELRGSSRLFLIFLDKLGFRYFIGNRETLHSRIHTRAGQNGQLPSILEIFCSETLFRKNIVIYHYLWYSTLVSSSTIFF